MQNALIVDTNRLHTGTVRTPMAGGEYASMAQSKMTADRLLGALTYLGSRIRQLSGHAAAPAIRAAGIRRAGFDPFEQMQRHLKSALAQANRARRMAHRLAVQGEIAIRGIRSPERRVRELARAVEHVRGHARELEDLVARYESLARQVQSKGRRY